MSSPLAWTWDTLLTPLSIFHSRVHKRPILLGKQGHSFRKFKCGKGNFFFCFWLCFLCTAHTRTNRYKRKFCFPERLFLSLRAYSPACDELFLSVAKKQSLSRTCALVVLYVVVHESVPSKMLGNVRDSDSHSHPWIMAPPCRGSCLCPMHFPLLTVHSSLQGCECCLLLATSCLFSKEWPLDGWEPPAWAITPSSPDSALHPFFHCFRRRGRAREKHWCERAS